MLARQDVKFVVQIIYLFESEKQSKPMRATRGEGVAVKAAGRLKN